MTAAADINCAVKRVRIRKSMKVEHSDLKQQTCKESLNSNDAQPTKDVGPASEEALEKGMSCQQTVVSNS